MRDTSLCLIRDITLPRVFREHNSNGKPHDENQLLQFFRMKGPVLGLECVPPRAEHTDQWLFLAQHVGLPTRLLDWTEGALVALYFALSEAKNQKTPVVWMLNPIELNRLSLPAGEELRDNVFPLTWIYPDDRINIGSENFRCAWEHKQRGLLLPIAVQPTSIHPRMSVQKSCFTIHGRREECLTGLVPANYLKKFEIDSKHAVQMWNDLRMLGISHSSLFPDLDGLTRELGEVF